MTDQIWCSSCGEEVSLARAVAELPCPVCGKTNYFVVATDAEHDALLSLFERMQRIGCWEVAEGALRRCLDQGYISQADYNLSAGTLSWRRDCVDAARSILSASVGPVSAGELQSQLVPDYDDYTVAWLLSEYSGFRHVKSGRSVYYEVPHGNEKA